MHVDFLEGCQQSIVILGLFQPLSNSLPEPWKRLSCFYTLSRIGLGRYLTLLLLGLLGFGNLLGLLFFHWFLCFFCGFTFRRFWLFLTRLSRRSCLFRLLSISIDIEESFTNIKIIPLTNIIFRNDSCMRALYFNGNFICFDIGDCLILINPLSLL